MSEPEEPSPEPPLPTEAAPEDEAALRRDAFARLPEAVQKEILDKRVQQAELVRRYEERLKKRMHGLVAAGAIVALGISLAFGGANPFFLLFMCCAGGSAAFLVVHFRGGHLLSITLYGGVTVVMQLLCMKLGLLEPAGPLMLVSWMTLSMYGGVMGFYLANLRSSEDTF
jgi:hypothetical protein